MAFEGLSEKLNGIFKKLKGKGVLTEADVREAMREVRLALLEADVHFKVVKDFVASVQEKSLGADKAIETIHNILSEYQPVDRLVLERMPPSPDPSRDLVFITRAGSLFPFYRTSSLLEQLMGTVQVPAVLFYPGELDGAAGLRFMGVLDAEHNYRPKIF